VTGLSGPPRVCVASTGDVLRPLQGSVGPATYLSLDELGRHAALVREADREDFVAVRLLARLLLAPYADLSDPSDPVEAVRRIVIRQTCPHCGGPHGRPRVEGPGLTGVGVSWAHADGVVAVAIAHSRVGVDVERLDLRRPRWGPAGAIEATDPAGSSDTADAHPRPGRVPGWPSDTLTASLDDLRSWVRGEALVKWGHADLDAALGWRLTAPAAQHGRRYVLPARGAPRPGRPVVAPWTRRVVVTDPALGEDAAGGAVVCAVAADRPAVPVALPVP
jgi:4'-phosphopantetheinyl transferase